MITLVCGLHLMTEAFSIPLLSDYHSTSFTSIPKLNSIKHILDKHDNNTLGVMYKVHQYTSQFATGSNRIQIVTKEACEFTESQASKQCYCTFGTIKLFQDFSLRSQTLSY